MIPNKFKEEELLLFGTIYELWCTIKSYDKDFAEN